ncbi:hypothetical protein ANN_21464 [Periplaneta americana]|uniref:EGF-like domain-containing protein n=1 Tax=Periplaneta americana TaxID=6978 RepID=A0ABQ8SH88_PERAM|nr:hypothetical protein ANN_21464 [Periplaneta americana]
MNDVIDNPADCEVRSVIRFLNARHLKPAEIYRQLKEVYGDTVMNERNVSHNTPETKRQSRQWHHPSSPKKPRKFKQTLSTQNVMATVFWDRKDVLLLDFMPKGTTINANRYCETLRKLRRAIQNKRLGMLSRGVVLLHDNARPHTVASTRELLDQFGWEIFDHSPYSPDLAPSDFHLFTKLKDFLGDTRFGSDEELKKTVNTGLNELAAEEYNTGILELVNRYDKCLNVGGAIRPSCHVQLPQCDSQPCMNGGLCTEGWNRFICDCTATSFTGPTCGKDATTLTFNGSQHMLITMPDEFRTQTEDVTLRFRTTRPLGLLLTTSTEQSADRLELALAGGRVRLTARLGDREKNFKNTPRMSMSCTLADPYKCPVILLPRLKEEEEEEEDDDDRDKMNAYSSHVN